MIYMHINLGIILCAISDILITKGNTQEFIFLKKAQYFDSLQANKCITASWPTSFCLLMRYVFLRYITKTQN